MPQRSPLRAVRLNRANAAILFFSSALTVTAAVPVAAETIDFSGELQSWRNGKQVETVHAQGATMRVSVEHHSSNVAVVFDTEHPKHYPELGTPNEDFDGPGEGDGGEHGARGENKTELGKVIVIAEDEDDLDDGAADLDDGLLRLSFSHAGYLTFQLINVDEDGTRIVAWRDGAVVGELEACDLGENSVQTIDLSRFGSVDRVAIDIEGVSAVAGIQLDVPVTGVQATTWTQVKRTYR